MNSALKHFAERALVGSGAAAVARRRFRGRTLVLAYHNVLPNGARLAGDRSLHLAQREFARQLDHLAECFDVIPLDAVENSFGDDRQRERAKVVITFDDAYAGALTAGVDELVKRGMPATIFVAPALLATVPWWDILGEDFGGEIPADVRNHALEELRGKAKAVLEWHLSQRSPRTGAERGSGGAHDAGVGRHLPEIASEIQLARAAAQPGISLGSHTWSHANLRALEANEVELELSQAREWLRARFSKVNSWVSYPYGSSTREVESAVARSGHTGALRIEGGWIPRSTSSMYALPRLNIPSGLSIDGFRLRLAGL